ncbi:MAG: hypothetical protein ACREF4_17115 [Gammaproteobacteria bacterium]
MSLAGNRFTTESRGECLIAAASGRDHDAGLLAELLLLAEPRLDDLL